MLGIAKIICGICILNDAAQVLNYGMGNSDELHTTAYYTARVLRKGVASYKDGTMRMDLNKIKARIVDAMFNKQEADTF